MKPIICFRPLSYLFRKNWYSLYRFKNKFECEGNYYRLVDCGFITFGYKWQIKRKDDYMKFCKDCKHIIIQKTATAMVIGFNCSEHAKCRKAPYTDPVTGEKEHYNYCRVQRSSRMIETDCGSDAKHFEPKEQ